MAEGSATSMAKGIVGNPSISSQTQNITPWREVAEKDEYRNLDPHNQNRAKLQYFDQMIAPQIPDNEYGVRRGEFLNYTGRLEIERDKPGFFSGILKDVSRAGGVALGTLNAPLAFIFGGMTEAEIDKEAFRELPFWQQGLVSLGAGFDAAWKSISEEGSFGTRYGDYYKEVTGETIEEALPVGFKWAAPTLEFLAELPFDPLIVEGGIANIFKKGVPKGWIGKLPRKVVNDLKQIEALEEAERAALDKAFTKIIKEREAFTAQKAKMYGPSKEFVSKVDKETPELSKLINDARILQKTNPTSAEKLIMENRINAFRSSKGLPPLTKVPKEHLKELQAADTLEKLNTFRESKGIPTIKLKATGGLIAGIEQDDEGNLQYNIAKGAMGALMVSGGVSVFNSAKQQRATAVLVSNPAWAKIHGTVGKVKSSFTVSGLLSRLNVTLFDRFAKLKQFSGKTYVAARIYASHKDTSQIKLEELRQAFKPVKKDEVVISDYINAHRMKTRAKRGLKNPDNVTLEDATTAIKEMNAYYQSKGGDVEVLKKAFGDFQKWTHDYMLREAFESGVISKDAYELIVKNNEFYATFEVLDHIPSNIHNIQALPGGEYFSVGSQKIIQKMVGTEKKIADPLEATIKKFTEAQALFAKNKVANTFIDDPIVKDLIRPIAKSPEEFGIMKNMGLDPVLEGSWSNKEFGVVARLKDGKVERYLVDQDIAEAMKQLTPYQAPRVLQAINAVFRKSATTVYIPFTISNAFRDALMAYTTAPVYKTKDIGKFFADWGKGFWEGAKHEFLGKSDLAEEYIKSGGGFGYVGNIRRPEQAVKALFTKSTGQKIVSVLKSPLELIEHVSATVELAPRLGVFKRAKMQGMTGKDAALTAKMATIDFNKGGVYTKVANQFIPFLNARIQGRVTVASALKRDPKGTLAKIFTATVVPGMSAYAWNRLYYSDFYDDIPEYVKQNYFTLITGTEIDKDSGREVPRYFLIPKGDVGQLSWNPIEFGIDAMFKKNPESVKEFLVNYLSDLSPIEFARRGELSLSKTAGGLLPPIVKGFAEDWANLNLYRGGEIVPYFLGKNKPPELQYKENTPETYKWIGKKLGISPLRLQNFAGNILAGYGREGLDPSAMARGLMGRIVRTKGGGQEQQAWIVIKDIEQGYSYIRSYAEEMVKAGDVLGAMNIMRQWNMGINEQALKFNDRFSKYGIEDRGGIVQSYGFSRRNISSLVKRIRKQSRSTESTLTQKLTKKRRR